MAKAVQSQWSHFPSETLQSRKYFDTQVHLVVKSVVAFVAFVAFLLPHFIYLFLSFGLHLTSVRGA